MSEGKTMGKIHDPEFRRKAVELYRLDGERTYAAVAREVGCSEEAIEDVPVVVELGWVTSG